MRQVRQDNDWHRALARVADGELRVKRQRELIKKIKREGRSTARAEDLLANFERSLMQMRNYVDLLDLLRQKNRYCD
jgi:hypothetical protein